MKVYVTAVGHMSDAPDDNFLMRFPIDFDEDADYVGMFEVSYDVLCHRYPYLFDLEEITLSFCADEEL